VTAGRIQARAIRRCGELLKQIPVDHDHGNHNTGNVTAATHSQPLQDVAAILNVSRITLYRALKE